MYFKEEESRLMIIDTRVEATRFIRNRLIRAAMFGLRPMSARRTILVVNIFDLPIRYSREDYLGNDIRSFRVFFVDKGVYYRVISFLHHGITTIETGARNTYVKLKGQQ